MIRETGIVVDVEVDAVWVETIQKTTCGNCVAKAGCGQRLLSKMTGHENRIRVALSEHSSVPEVGDSVSLGIPEASLVKGALLVYLLPVAGLVSGAYIGSVLLQSDMWSAVLGMAGVLLGGLLVRCHSRLNRNNRSYCPALLSTAEEQPVNFR